MSHVITDKMIVPGGILPSDRHLDTGLPVTCSRCGRAIPDGMRVSRFRVHGRPTWWIFCDACTWPSCEGQRPN